MRKFLITLAAAASAVAVASPASAQVYTNVGIGLGYGAPAYGYDAWGNALQGTAPLTDFGYAGMFDNAESGLYLTLFRAYDPVAGRWLSAAGASMLAWVPRPCAIAVTSEKALAVEPNWNPPDPPYFASTE